MSVPTWDQVWMQVARVVSQRSRCSRANIGAVIVDSNQRVCATGYNGAAANYPTNGMCINWCERAQGKTELTHAYEGCPSIHAEANALLYVDRSAVAGGTIYITGSPCMQCAKLISNSGIARVVTVVSDSDWHRSPELVLQYLRLCGILVETVKDFNDEWFGERQA